MQRIRLHSSVTLTVCRVSPGAVLTDVPTAPGAPSCLSPSVLFPGAWSPGAPPAVISANRFGPGPCSPLSSWGPSRPSPLPLKCALLIAKRSAPRSGGVIRSATSGSQDLATGEPGDLHRRHKCHLRVRWFANARWLPVHCPLIASLLFEERVCVCVLGGGALGVAKVGGVSSHHAVLTVVTTHLRSAGFLVPRLCCSYAPHCGLTRPRRFEGISESRMGPVCYKSKVQSAGK